MDNSQLTQFLELLRTDLINALQAGGRDASGQTASQILVTTDGASTQLQIPGYLPVLESGRGPTGPDAASGDPPMIDRIRQWCQAKGIPDKAAWAIKKSIDKKGFKGTSGLLSMPLGDENISFRLNPQLEDMADDAVAWLADNLIL